MAISYASPINKQAQEDENTILSIQSFQDDELPPALDCGRNQKHIDTLRDMFQLIPEQGRALALQSEIRNMLDADIRLAELLGDKIAYKKYFHPKAPESMYQKPKEDDWACPALPNYAYLNAALADGACPWLDWYEAFSKKASSEAFPGFHIFCALFLLSAIAGRRVHLEIKGEQYCTNLLIAFVAETSFFAKSHSQRLIRRLLRALDLSYRLGPDKPTPQKLLSDMAGKYALTPEEYDALSLKAKQWWEGRLAAPGQVALIFDELGKFIQRMGQKNSTSAEFIDLLLILDACPPDYQPATISRGGELIEKPYVPVLGNVTPVNVKENAKASAEHWTDGFWARFSFVVAPPATPETIKEDDEDDDDDDDFLPIPQRIINELRDWDERLGPPECVILAPETDDKKKDKSTDNLKIDRKPLSETACTITTDARKAWKSYRRALKRMALNLPHRDFTGSYTRLSETALRISILLASLSNHNVIDLKIWTKAQMLAEQLRGYLHELYKQVNTSDSDAEDNVNNLIKEKLAEHTDELKALTASVIRSSSRILRRFKPRIFEDEILKALVDAGEIKKCINAGGIRRYYIAGGAA